MTKKEMFAEIRKVVIDNAEMVAFIDHEVELLNRKSGGTRKPTKNQLENAQFKADILAALAEVGKPVTIKELCEVCPTIAGLTNQRITHMLTDLRKGGEVTREYIKRVAYFTVGNEGEQSLSLPFLGTDFQCLFLFSIIVKIFQRPGAKSSLTFYYTTNRRRLSRINSAQ